MIPVARAKGVTVSCPADGRYAFYNSPYPAHRLSTSIDVYPNLEFGDVASSPVGGVVELVRRVRSPRGRGFKDPGYDVVTLLRSQEDPTRVVKLLHVEPVVETGDALKPGMKLGRLLRSGYYGFGTSPHIHVEIRDPDDPLRARGGHKVTRLMGIGDVEPPEELRGVVTRSLPEFSIVRLEGTFAIGLPADVGGVTGLLDGGVPYYGWLGAHIGSELPKNGTVRLLGKPIATIRNVQGKVCFADCLDFVVRVDGVAIHGLSLHLFPGKGTDVKLMPRRLGGLRLEEGAEVSLTIG